MYLDPYSELSLMAAMDDLMVSSNENGDTARGWEIVSEDIILGIWTGPVHVA